jgi:hypothetical protein
LSLLAPGVQRGLSGDNDFLGGAIALEARAGVLERADPSGLQSLGFRLEITQACGLQWSWSDDQDGVEIPRSLQATVGIEYAVGLQARADLAFARLQVAERVLGVHRINLEREAMLGTEAGSRSH